MSYELTAKQLMDALSSGKKPRERPRIRWRDYAEDLVCSRLAILPVELSLVARDWDA